MEITKAQFMRYEEIRRSGQTNMFHIRNVKTLSGLSEEQIFNIQNKYGELARKFLDLIPQNPERKSETK